MATRKPKAKKPPIQNPTILRTVALSQDDELALAQLSQEVADRIGRAPSRSAVFRALLRLARDFDGAMLERLGNVPCAACCHRKGTDSLSPLASDTPARGSTLLPRRAVSPPTLASH